MSTGMRTRTTAFLAGLLLVVSASVASAQASGHDADTAASLRTLEHLKFEALQQQDGHALDPILDDLIFEVDQDGTLLPKAQYLAELRNAATTSLRIIPESLTVRVFDGVAIVVGIYDEKGMRAGRPYHRRCRFVDTWMLKNRKWLCIAATATSAIA